MNLNLILKVFIICLGLLETVSSTPTPYTASDGRVYIIEPDQRYIWLDAWHVCASKGYQLLIIDSAEKNNVIINLLKRVLKEPTDLWLGGNDEFNSSEGLNRAFFWAPTGKPFNFTFWSEDNPDNARYYEHCVHIWKLSPSYKWNDYFCTRSLGFICEINRYRE